MLRKSALISLCVLGTALGCSDNAKFKGAPQSGEAPKAADVIPEPILVPSLDVTVPVNEIRSGRKTLRAKAEVKDAKKTAVVWTLSGPEGIDIGSISTQGVYTSPDILKEEISVVITATLASDAKISDSETIRAIPAEKIFVGCSAGSEVFPIKAEVFRLPIDTQRLPDFDAITGDKISTVCMDQYNVPQRSFDEGFPGVEGLNEWFALHTTGKIIIKDAGEYNFRLTSDDGSMFYIDGTTVVDNNGLHSATPREGSITLSPGLHDFVLDYYQGPANQIALELFWQTPGSTEFVIVPPSAFLKLN